MIRRTAILLLAIFGLISTAVVPASATSTAQSAGVVAPLGERWPATSHTLNDGFSDFKPYEEFFPNDAAACVIAGWETDDVIGVGYRQDAQLDFQMEFAAGANEVTVSAVADKPGGVKANVYVDHKFVQQVVWDDDQDNCVHDRSFTVEGIIPGPQRVSVEFVNDAVTANWSPHLPAAQREDEDRNLFLAGIKIEQARSSSIVATAKGSDFMVTRGGDPVAFDGIDDRFNWSFDFTGQPGLTAIAGSAPLTTAVLTLELTPRNSQIDTDDVGIVGLGQICSPAPNAPDCLDKTTDVFADLIVGREEWVSLNLLEFYSSDQIKSILTSGASGQLPMQYRDDAWVNSAVLELTAAERPDVPPEDRVIRILTVGDSITYAYGNNDDEDKRIGYSYRCKLWKKLTEAYRDVRFEFVGPVKDLQGGEFVDGKMKQTCEEREVVDSPYSFSNDRAAWGAHQIHEILEDLILEDPILKDDPAHHPALHLTTDQSAVEAGRKKIDPELNFHIALVHVGTNNILGERKQGGLFSSWDMLWEDADPSWAASVEKDLTGLLVFLGNQSSTGTILLSAIIPCSEIGYYEGACNNVDSMNSIIRGARGRIVDPDLRERIVLLEAPADFSVPISEPYSGPEFDVRSKFDGDDGEDDLPDPDLIHPNDSGAEKMAINWFEGISGIVGPNNPG